MAQYYLAKNGQQTGPFSVDQLLQNGLTADSLVFAQGMAAWTKASDVPELAAMLAPAAAPAPQPQYQQPQYQAPQPAYQPQQAYQQPAGGRVDKQKIDMYMMTNKDNFPPERLPYIQERLSMLDENTFNTLSMQSFKSPMTALLLSIFAGSLGVDRVYLGDTGLGIGKLLTAGGCGIWAIIDWFKIQGAARQKNFDAIAPYIQ